jgi:hypothetical protein
MTAAALAAFPACSREPLASICPDVAPGDLVITEVRGPQQGPDAADLSGEWIELYNASGETLDLAGLRLELQKLDGTGALGFIVRRRGVEVEPGGYAVLGRFADGAEPSHVDYGYRGDLDSSLHGSGAIEVVACDVTVDRLIYRNLSDRGTLALDGAIDPPTAEANDDAGATCVDDAVDPAAPSAGARGTPGEENPACP